MHDSFQMKKRMCRMVATTADESDISETGKSRKDESVCELENN